MFPTRNPTTKVPTSAPTIGNCFDHFTCPPYYTNKGTASLAARWYLGDQGENCDATCAKQSSTDETLSCQVDRMRAVTGGNINNPMPVGTCPANRVWNANGITGPDFQEGANGCHTASSGSTCAATAWWASRLCCCSAADEAADAQELADTITDMQARYDANDLWWNTRYDATVVTYDSMLSVTNDTLDYHRAPIEIDLHTQWNTVAYYLHHESPVVAQFENQFGSETAIANNINIVKNNEGLFYWHINSPCWYSWIKRSVCICIYCVFEYKV